MGLLGLAEAEALWLNDTLASMSADAAANFCLELDPEVLQLLQACANGFSRALSFLDDHDHFRAKLAESNETQGGALEPTLLSRFDQEMGCNFFNPLRRKATLELRRHLQQQQAILENSIVAGMFVGFDSFELQAPSGTHIDGIEKQATVTIQARAAQSLSADALELTAGVSSAQGDPKPIAQNTVRLRENRQGHLYKALLPSQGTGSGRGSQPGLFWVPQTLRRIDFDGFAGTVSKFRFQRFQQFEDGQGDDGGADVFDFEQGVQVNNEDHDSDEPEAVTTDVEDSPTDEGSGCGDDDIEFMDSIRRDTTVQHHFVDRVGPKSLLRSAQPQRVFSGLFLARRRSRGVAHRRRRSRVAARQQSRGSQLHGATGTLARVLEGVAAADDGPIATRARRGTAAGNSRRLRKNRLYARDFLLKGKSTGTNMQLQRPCEQRPSEFADGLHQMVGPSTAGADTTALDTRFAIDVWLSLDDELVPPPLNNIALNDGSDTQASVVSFEFERDIKSAGLTMTVKGACRAALRAFLFLHCVFARLQAIICASVTCRSRRDF